MTIAGNGNAPEDNGNIGGRLTFRADRIDSTGSIILSSGMVHLAADGTDSNDGIYMRNVLWWMCPVPEMQKNITTAVRFTMNLPGILFLPKGL